MLALAFAAGVPVGACGGTSSFLCDGAEDCVDGAIAGFCEADRHCSFGDAVCPSGRRYGEHAPTQLAGTCVPEGGTSGVAETSGAPTSTTTSTVTGAPESTGSMSTEGSSTSAVVTSESSSPSSTGMRTDSGSSSTTDGSMGGCIGTECGNCVLENCASEWVGCMGDPGCECQVACACDGTCDDPCADSPAAFALSSCVQFQCPECEFPPLD